MTKTTCFDVFEQSVKAVQAGELIESESEKHKEFHFQNWVKARLEALSLNFDEPGRNTYPDFRLVKFTEGYEVKGLKWPGRDASYDSNRDMIECCGRDRKRTFFLGKVLSPNTTAGKENVREQE